MARQKKDIIVTGKDAEGMGSVAWTRAKGTAPRQLMESKINALFPEELALRPCTGHTALRETLVKVLPKISNKTMFGKPEKLTITETCADTGNEFTREVKGYAIALHSEGSKSMPILARVRTCTDMSKPVEERTWQLDWIDSRVLPATKSAIEQAFNERANQVSANEVGDWARDVFKFHNGVMVNRGTYFVPPESKSELDKVEQVFEAIDGAADEDSVFWLCEMPAAAGSQKTMKTLVRWFAKEIADFCDKADDKISTGDMGKRACKTQKADAQALIEKLETWKKLLGPSVDMLKKSIEDVTRDTDAFELANFDL